MAKQIRRMKGHEPTVTAGEKWHWFMPTEEEGFGRS